MDRGLLPQTLTALLISLVTLASGRELVLALEDNFDMFNLSLWKHEITLGGGGNWEFEYYTNNRSSSYVKGGALYIQPTLLADEIGEANVVGNNYMLDIWGLTPSNLCTSNAFYGCLRQARGGGNILNPVKSAKLRTSESFSFRYGKVEVSAKLPRGDWLWPSVWLMPRDNQYGSWPASGEIDMMESVGNPPSYAPGGYDIFTSTLHWGPSVSQDKWSMTHASKKPGVDPTADFHTYGLIWNETYIGTYFDDESNTVLSVPIEKSFWELGGWQSPPWHNPWEGAGNNAPFDSPMYLIINVAVGGTNGYFPDGNGKPWTNSDPHAVNSFYNAKDQWFPTWTSPMAVDSVKVWTYADTNN